MYIMYVIVFMIILFTTGSVIIISFLLSLSSNKINIKKRESRDMITTYFAEAKSPQSSFEGEVGDFVDVLVVKSPQSSEASEFTQNKKSKILDG